MNDLLLPLKAVAAGDLARGLEVLQQRPSIDVQVRGYRRPLTLSLTRVETGLQLDAIGARDQRRVLLASAEADEDVIVPREWRRRFPGPEPEQTLHYGAGFDIPETWAELADMARRLMAR